MEKPMMGSRWIADLSRKVAKNVGFPPIADIARLTHSAFDDDESDMSDR
jgi:hypothetical protein